MWRIEPSQLYIFRGPGGQAFTSLLDTLIRAHMAALGGLDSAVHTNMRTNKPDGGVDTAVDLGLDNDDSGWMQYRTTWQYKATEGRSVMPGELREEAKKDYVIELAENGYGYRFCICDSVPPKQQDEWKDIIDEEISKHTSNASPAKVLTADHIAHWISQYPALVVAFFNQWAENALPIDVWTHQSRSLTDQYVPVGLWETVEANLRDHVNFAVDATSALLPIHGDPGTGKTRLVCETLNDIVGSREMVVYVADDSVAIQIATQLANTPQTRAILVADECSLDRRFDLATTLDPIADRVRAITITNVEDRPKSATPENVLEQMSMDTVLEVLERNFPEIPIDARRNYAELSAGFIRLAADLCRHHNDIIVAGNLDPARLAIEQYLVRRLQNDEKLSVISALSLFVKVGFREKVSDELDFISQAIGIDRNRVQQICIDLKDQTGFVQLGGRYFYVTPDIVSKTLFPIGWRQFGEPDIESFLSSLPGDLIEAFEKSLSKHGNESARKAVADFFLAWALSLEPNDLQDSSVVSRLESLCDTKPDRYFRVAADLVESASDEVLKNLGRAAYGGWGVRRNLVFLAERMAAFPEFFEDAERLLLRLATCETEKNISNNATGVWRDLYRMMLSGTAKPFPERLPILLDRIENGTDEVRAIGISALGEIFGSRGSKTVGASVIAGRIAPEEWRPKTWGEYWKHQKETLNRIKQVVPKLEQSDRDAIADQIVDVMNDLLNAGAVTEISQLVEALTLSISTKANLKNAAERYITFNKKSDTKSETKEYFRSIENWMESLSELGMDGRLVDLLSKDSWYYLDEQQRETWHESVRSLAQEIVGEPDIFVRNLDWLNSDNAKSSQVLGTALGELDDEGMLFDTIIDSAIGSGNAQIATAYTASLIKHFPVHTERSGQRFDEILEFNPDLASELVAAAGDKLGPVEWTARHVESGALGAEKLLRFFYWVGDRQATHSQVGKILDLIEKEDADSRIDWLHAVIRGLGYVATQFDAEVKAEISKDPKIIEQARKLLLAAVNEKRTQQGYEWERVARMFFGDDVSSLVELCISALMGDNLHLDDKAEEMLIELAPDHTKLILGKLGEADKAKKTTWTFQIRVYRKLFEALKLEALDDWLNKAGLDGAKLIARHLPIPFVDDNGLGVVPEITDQTLRRFGDDEDVFSRFTAGIHSFQSYVGPISSHHEEEAATAEKFLDHDNPVIRKWSKLELRSARSSAEEWAEIEAEQDLE